MQITQENTGNLTATIRIELDKADYTGKVEEKLKSYRKKMKMPGFREGKVPLGVVNKMYGKAILAEEINTIISEALTNYLTDNEIKTIASPLPNREKQEMIDFDTQESFSFWFDLGLRPEINPELEALEPFEKFEIEPDEEKVEDYLQHILKRYGNLEEQDTIMAESVVQCDIAQLDPDGELLEDGITAEGSISIEKISSEDLRNQFIGNGTGTKVVMNPMAAFDHNVAEVSSLLNIQRDELPEPMGDFSFTVKTIKNLVPATLNEELMKEVFSSDEITTEEAFMDRIRKDIKDSYNHQAEQWFIGKAFDAVISGQEIELPDDFLKRWLMESDEEGKLTAMDLEEGYESYRDHLKFTLIRNSLMQKYEITLQQDDLVKYVGKVLNLIAEGEEPDEQKMATINRVIEGILSDEKQSEKIQERIIEQKLSDVILEKAPSVQKTITSLAFDAMIKQEDEERKKEEIAAGEQAPEQQAEGQSE
jgi:trigger factor